jgi:hypothetical protein
VLGAWLSIGGPLATAAPACVGCGSPGAASYWGAALGDGVPWNWAPVSAFRRLARKPPSLVAFGRPFEDCSTGACRFEGFPTAVMQRIRSHGAIPLLSWSSGSFPLQRDEPSFGLRELITGRYDWLIWRFAAQARAWGHPFFLRFDWEMNGNWFPWGQRVQGNSPREFVAAWRHVHRIFTAAGATNATWVWCPNIDPGHFWTSVSSLYPGDAYVDWTCLDGYNWGRGGPKAPTGARGGWRSFNSLFRSTYLRIVDRVAPGKPMIIGEVSSSDRGGSRRAWIANMFHELPDDYPDIRGFVWYDESDDWGFHLRAGSPAARAFAAGVRAASYAPNAFCRLGQSPVAPASRVARASAC